MADEQHRVAGRGRGGDVCCAASPSRPSTITPGPRPRGWRPPLARGACPASRPASELPGEAAALAAFREASRGGKRAGAAGPAGAARQQDALHTVRIGAARTATAAAPALDPPAALRPRRRARRVRARRGRGRGRYGHAPGAVRRRRTPAPRRPSRRRRPPRSWAPNCPTPVSPASPLPSTSPGVPGSPRPRRPRRAATAGGVRADREDGGGAADREETGPDSGTGSTQDDTDGREVPGGSSSRAEVLKKSIKACRGYREDTLSQEEKARLLELADGERNLDRFCDRLLGGGRR